LAKFTHIIFVVFFIFFVFPVLGSDFILVIDPGHGGRETGALGKKGREKDINLAVAKLVGQYITDEHPDVKIIYTRTKDVATGLDERANIANKANANLFISIHANAVKGSSSASGAEVYTFGVARFEENLAVAKRENSVILFEKDYEQKYEGFDPNSSESYIIFEFMVNLYSEQSISFASMVQKELVKTAKRKDRGVRQAGFLVLRKSSMPSILIELDFITNPDAENYMLSQTGQRNLARSICNAFTEYKKEFDRMENRPTISPTPAEQLPQVILDKNQLPETSEQLPEKVVEAKKTVKSEKTIESEQPVELEKTVTPQKPVSSGRIYKVQILASTKKLPDNSKELKGYKASYYVEGIYYKYTCGESQNWNEINELRKKVTKDFKGAFIVAFENGVKIPNK